MRILFLGNADKELMSWLQGQGETVVFANDKVDIDYVKKIEPDLIISHGYRYRLAREVIKYPRVGAINLHISYLPYNRGADPNIWSFLENTPKGVTIHFIDEGIDSGDILFQERVEFNKENETLESTYMFLQSAIKTLFKKTWPKIKKEKFSLKKQDAEGTIHAKRDRVKFEDLLKWQGWQTPIKKIRAVQKRRQGIKIDAIIQARTDSTRLYAKVLKKLKGKTILRHILERVKQSKNIDNIIVATTISEIDRKIAHEAKEAGVKCFRGSKEDVLSRYYYAAKENKSDVVVRITSDCPLIDPLIMDRLIYSFLDLRDIDYLSNIGAEAGQRTYPRGLDVEIFTFRALKKAFNEAKAIQEREHVTPYFYLHPEIFNLKFIKNDIDYSKYRWTLDTDEDWELIKEIYDRLYEGRHDFYLGDLLTLLSKEPGLARINAAVKQKVT